VTSVIHRIWLRFTHQNQRPHRYGFVLGWLKKTLPYTDLDRKSRGPHFIDQAEMTNTKLRRASSAGLHCGSGHVAAVEGQI